MIPFVRSKNRSEEDRFSRTNLCFAGRPKIGGYYEDFRWRCALWAQGSRNAQGKGAARLAEVAEGESEAQLGEEAEEILPCRDVVDSQTETIDRRWGGSIGVVGRSFRQKGVNPYRGKVEISGARGGWVIISA